MSSKQIWKGRSGKTKRGKPTGPREVLEKYSAVEPDFLEWHNHKQHKVYDRVLGSGFCCNWCLSVAERNRHRTKRGLKASALAEAEDYLLERAEQEAHWEPARVVQQDDEGAQDQVGEQAGAAAVQAVDPAVARAWARSLRASPSVYQPTQE